MANKSMSYGRRHRTSLIKGKHTHTGIISQSMLSTRNFQFNELLKLLSDAHAYAHSEHIDSVKS